MRRQDDGAVAVEFALLLPLLVAILLAITDYGLWYSDSISLRSAAREGARMAVVDGYPNACTDDVLYPEPADKTVCTVNEQARLIGGTPAVKVYVEGVVGAGADREWVQGNRLIVCTAVKVDGISGFSPLPADGVLRTRVAMRLETSQGGTSEVAGDDPGDGDWDWCVGP